MHFFKLPYSVSTTFYEVYEYIKIPPTERNCPIYEWADLYISQTFHITNKPVVQRQQHISKQNNE